MTANELAAELAQDQETTKTKIEDLLLALRDIMIEKLAAGEMVTLGHIGTFQIRPIFSEGDDQPKAAIRFRPLAEMREQLNLANPRWEPGEVCPDCKKRPRKREPRCSTCKNERWPNRRTARIRMIKEG